MNLPLYRRAATTAGRLLIASSIALVVLGHITGCAVTTEVWDDKSVKAPAKIANITVGQPAYVYFRKFDLVSRVDEDLAAWRATGLFKSVSRTMSVEPIKSGVYISVDCELSYIRDQRQTLVAMLTLFVLIPGIMEDYVNDCKMDYYQDTVKVATANANVTFRNEENGFGLIPLWLRREKQNTIIAQEAAAIRVANMMKALNK